MPSDRASAPASAEVKNRFESVSFKRSFQPVICFSFATKRLVDVCKFFNLRLVRNCQSLRLRIRYLDPPDGCGYGKVAEIVILLGFGHEVNESGLLLHRGVYKRRLSALKARLRFFRLRRATK